MRSVQLWFGAILICSRLCLLKAATRINFLRCSFNGFTCETTPLKKTNVYYQCPKGVNDVIIYINQFAAPANIERLSISSCDTLTLSTRCTNENKPMLSLKVSNIRLLIIQRLQYESMIPQDVLFENITYIETIPTHTFAQIDKSLHSVGCVQPKTDFVSLKFHNVIIGTIQPEAFLAKNHQFKNFTFSHVKVQRLQSLGVSLKMGDNGGFHLTKSSFEVVEHLGITVTTKHLTVSNSTFNEISSSGFNGTFENFHFVNNTVNTLQPHAFSVLATNIYILENTFLYLKGGALERLSPGLLRDSGMSFGKLRFVYDFSKNQINFVDAGSLNPDMVAFENVAVDMAVGRNRFFCSCENLGWLFSGLGHGTSSTNLVLFYELLLSRDSDNVCAYSCNLPIKSVEKLSKDGKCVPGRGIDWACVQAGLKKELVTVETPHYTTVKVEELQLNSSSALGSGNGSGECTISYLYCVFISIIVYLG